MKKAKMVVLSLLLLAFVLTAAAGVSELWPGLFKEHDHASGVDSEASRGVTDNADYAVPGPAAIVILGAGLVSLGFYARQKRRRQQ